MSRSCLSPLVCSLILIGSLYIFLSISVLSIYLEKQNKKSSVKAQDDFLTARNSQAWWSLGLSFYSGGMGSWLLFAAPEVGYDTGWLGSIGYGVSNASPFWLMMWLGPKVKDALGGSRGFTVSDFVRERYGRNAQVGVVLASLFFMFIFLSAELTSIAGVFTSVSDSFPPYAATIPVSLVTMLYIVIGGAPTAIFTDRIQGLLLMVLGSVAVGVVSFNIVPELTEGSFAAASKPSIKGLNAVVVLWLSTTINQFLDQGMWQRVFASRSNKDARLGLFLSGFLSVPTVAFFAFSGIFAAAAQASGIIDDKGFPFFLLLRRLSPFWLGLIVFFGVGLVCSTVDSLQGGLMGLIAGEFVPDHPHLLLLTRVGLVLINCAATAVSISQYSVLGLFLTSNIISCAIVPMLGLAFSSYVSSTAVLIGTGCGLLSILICGWITKETFIGGFQWFILPDGVSHYTTALTFVTVPIVTVTSTLLAAMILNYKDTTLQAQQKTKLNAMKTLPESPVTSNPFIH